MVKLRNETDEENPDMVSHGIALAELIAYIDECRTDDDVAPVFKLADLAKLYSTIQI